MREIYSRPEGAAVQKRWRKLDRFMRAFVGRSPFLCLGTANAAGQADVAIGEVFLHRPKALKRSRLWNLSQHADRASFPYLPLDLRADPRILGDAGHRDGLSAGRAAFSRFAPVHGADLVGQKAECGRSPSDGDRLERGPSSSADRA